MVCPIIVIMYRPYPYSDLTHVLDYIQKPRLGRDVMGREDGGPRSRRRRQATVEKFRVFEGR